LGTIDYRLIKNCFENSALFVQYNKQTR